MIYHVESGRCSLSLSLVVRLARALRVEPLDMTRRMTRDQIRRIMRSAEP